MWPAHPDGAHEKTGEEPRPGRYAEVDLKHSHERKYRLLPGHVAVVQRLADALVKLVALQPIQFDCLRVGEYVHAARYHAVDRLLGFAAEVGSEGRRSIEKPASG